MGYGQTDEIQELNKELRIAGQRIQELEGQLAVKTMALANAPTELDNRNTKTISGTGLQFPKPVEAGEPETTVAATGGVKPNYVWVDTTDPQHKTLREFVDWLMEQTCEGGDVNGGDIQSKAEELGLLELRPILPEDSFDGETEHYFTVWTPK